MDTNSNPTTYTMPTVIDCLGRYPTILTVNPLKIPGGGGLPAADTSVF